MRDVWLSRFRQFEGGVAPLPDSLFLCALSASPREISPLCPRAWTPPSSGPRNDHPGELLEERKLLDEMPIVDIQDAEIFCSSWRLEPVGSPSRKPWKRSIALCLFVIPRTPPAIAAHRHARHSNSIESLLSEDLRRLTSGQSGQCSAHAEPRRRREMLYCVVSWMEPRGWGVALRTNSNLLCAWRLCVSYLRIRIDMPR